MRNITVIIIRRIRKNKYSIIHHEHKKQAKKHGAIGSTDRADELFQLVMGIIASGS